MKKNILTVVILAATLVNLTLSAVMLFVYMPNAQRMNTLITKICETIDLELESPLPVHREPEPTAADLEPYTIGTEMMVSLTQGSDNKSYFASITATVVLNKKASDYSKISPLMTTQAERIKEIVQIEIGKLTSDNFYDERSNVRDTVLALLQEEFDTECIYRVDFGQYVMGR